MYNGCIEINMHVGPGAGADSECSDEDILLPLTMEAVITSGRRVVCVNLVVFSPSFINGWRVIALIGRILETEDGTDISLSSELSW